jgi:ribosome-associated toxin RatA of RatAB toxin-antitoxin module
LTGSCTKASGAKARQSVATICATTMVFNLVVAIALSVCSLPAQAKSVGTEAEILKEAQKEAQTPANQKELAAAAAKTGARGDGKGATWCTARTPIKAPPEIVWRAVHDERQNDPDISYSKVLEQSENQFKLEQKFCFIPFLGTSTCVTHQTEVPNQRIDYKLVKSDHFKAMEGSWVLSPADGGKSTVLEFSSHLDLGLPVPKCLMDGVTSKKMEKRLAHIKVMAEKNHAAIAEKSNQTSSL